MHDKPVTRGSGNPKAADDSSKIVVRLNDPANPYRKKKSKRFKFCGRGGSYGMIGTYGEIVRPINTGAAIGVGMLGEDGHRTYEGGEKLTWDASQAARLQKVLGVTYELSCKCLKNELDRFECLEFGQAVALRLSRPIEPGDRQLVEKAVRIIAGKPAKSNLKKAEASRAQKDAAVSDASWRLTRICPHCDSAGRLNKDFRFCPMCGGRLP